jgi:hypothetical protein
MMIFVCVLLVFYFIDGLLDSCERWVPGGRTSGAQQAHGHRGRIDHPNPLNFYKQKYKKCKS